MYYSIAIKMHLDGVLLDISLERGVEQSTHLNVIFGALRFVHRQQSISWGPCLLVS